ncbi:amyloid fiber anchoring/assembly protein TapA [Sutcliffiella horikoshii]|uniref:amyloid fiber anchoring/assembly protein TapA n=1 Tax=Sutcliffiella horikoshii TaxID=79883 RepID=UPI00384DB80A
MRTTKYRRKSKQIILFMKFLAIWYILVFTGTYLTSTTGAAFNDIEQIKNHLHTKWDVEEEEETPPPDDWDKSSLEVLSIQASCEKVVATVKNGGSDALGPIPYEIRWSEKGNAKDGEVLETGEISSLAAGGDIEITHIPTKNGKYRISVEQHVNHPGNSEPTEAIELKNCKFNNLDSEQKEIQEVEVEELEKAEEEAATHQEIKEEDPVEVETVEEVESEEIEATNTEEAESESHEKSELTDPQEETED